MSARFRDRPIRQKVMLLIGLSCALGLGLAALAVLLYELTTSRPRALRDAITQAAIVRVNSIPALVFSDSAAAAENLRTLNSRREIGAAAIWRADRRLFASYRRKDRPPLLTQPPATAGSRFAGDELFISQPLVSDGELVGWLTLQYEMPPLLQRLPQYGIMVAVVVLALAGTAALLLGMLETSVTTPLRRLAGTARSITGTRDFRIRLPQGPSDEIGALTDAWNEMLGTVEESQAALQNSELRLRLALQAAVMETTVLELNPLERREEALGNLLRGVHADDRARVERAIQQAVSTRGTLDIEYRESAGERWTALRGQVAADGSRLLGVVQDVTQRRRLELQLLESQKMEAIGNLAGGIAHDFNNLLTGIIGYLRFVQKELPPETQLRQDVDEAERAAQRAAELTSQLLSYARRQMVLPTIVDLRKTVQSVQPMLQRLLGEDVVLSVESSPDLWRTRIDSNQMGNVLVNLAVNARDAMPRGGRLRLALRNVIVAEGHPALRASELQPGEYVELKVTDTGAGIPPDVLPHIFEPFFTTKPPGSGTGLGLAMCYGMVKQAGGDISVESETGRGTSFTMLLPRAETSEPEAPVTPELDAFPRGTETILVVEDNATVRLMVSRALRSAGYKVLEADGGDAALDCARMHVGTIDLLLTDVVMPGLNGAELAALVVNRRPGTRVMFMSGYTDDARAGRGIARDGVPLLSKPFTPGEVARAVRRALDQTASTT